NAQSSYGDAARHQTGRTAYVAGVREWEIKITFLEAGVYWSILHRMIFWELARVFILALVALTGMLVMGGVVAEATQRGLGPIQLLQAIPLLIPSTLPYTLPATTLFATCVVYGRLAHDNEILALKAAGVHLWHVI